MTTSKNLLEDAVLVQSHCVGVSCVNGLVVPASSVREICGEYIELHDALQKLEARLYHIEQAEYRQSLWGKLFS